MLCKGEKISTLSNLDEKGVTEVTPNQGDPYCPECLEMPKYPKIPTPGTSNLPGVVLNEFSSYARSNFLIWYRVRPREAKFLF